MMNVSPAPSAPVLSAMVAMTASRMARTAAGCGKGGLSTPGPTLLTICSQTVRIHADVEAHRYGKRRGQAHTDGRVDTSRDGPAGFKSRHPAQVRSLCCGRRSGAASARTRAGATHRATAQWPAAVPSACPYRRVQAVTSGKPRCTGCRP